MPPLSNLALEDIHRLAQGGSDEPFDRIAALTANTFDAPVALVSFIDESMQWVRARVGVDMREGRREDSICRHVVDDPSHAVLMVEDLQAEPRFAYNPHVVGQGFRFYAGAPLMWIDGSCIGSLCILDYEPRPILTEKERTQLVQLAGLVQSELELRQLHRTSEESRRLLALAESVADVGHWHYSLRHDHVTWSDQVYRIHGVDPESYNPNLTGGIDFYLPDDRIKVVEAMQQAISSRSGFDFELRIRRSDGAIRDVFSKAVCEFDDQGNVIAVFGVFQDVTGKLAVIDDLKRARKSAEAASTAKSTFLANLSHELRTPLNSIIGFSEILRSAVDAPATDRAAQRRHLQHIEEAGRNLLALVDDVLDLAKLEAGRMTMRAQSFEPRTLAAQVLAMVAPQAEKRGLLLRLDAPAEANLALLGDADRLRQVLLNLLANAIKFTVAGSVVLKLDLRRDGDAAFLSFEVEDTGVGIASDELGTLFERFRQLETAVGTETGGSGLGLAISKSIIETMEGSLTVRSRLGEGSVFAIRLRLPLDRDPAQAESQAFESSLRAPHRILVAEDLAMNRELIRVMLASLGCTIDFAQDGEECVRKIQGNAYTLVLMDVRMPKVDGVAATRIIKSLGGRLAQIPILAMTADSLPETLEACFEAGMVDHVHKPIARRDLEAKVRHWLQPR